MPDSIMDCSDYNSALDWRAQLLNACSLTRHASLSCLYHWPSNIVCVLKPKWSEPSQRREGAMMFITYTHSAILSQWLFLCGHARIRKPGHLLNKSVLARLWSMGAICISETGFWLLHTGKQRLLLQYSKVCCMLCSKSARVNSKSPTFKMLTLSCTIIFRELQRKMNEVPMFRLFIGDKHVVGFNMKMFQHYFKGLLLFSLFFACLNQ